MDITFSQPKPEHAEKFGKICLEAFRSISEKHNFPRDFESAEDSIGLMEMIGSWDQPQNEIAGGRRNGK